MPFLHSNLNEIMNELSQNSNKIREHITMVYERRYGTVAIELLIIFRSKQI